MVVVEAWEGDWTLLCGGGSLLLYNHRTLETRLIDLFSRVDRKQDDGTDENATDEKKNEGTDENETENRKTKVKGDNGTEDGMVDKETEGKEHKGTDDRKAVEIRIDGLKVAEDSGSGSGDGKVDSGTEQNENGRTDEKERHKIKDNMDDDSSRSIIAAKFSVDGKLMALACGWKTVEVWRTADCKQMTEYKLVKKPTALAMVEGWVLVADKAGDVYQFPLPSSSSSTTISTSKEEAKPILGHLSMLLDVTTTPDARFIITSDRDEKVRVTHLTPPHPIHTFCLGHREFVSRIEVVTAIPPRLLSGSGDGYLKLWNYETGQCLSELQVSSFSSPYLLPREAAEDEEGGKRGEEDSSSPTPPSTSPSPPAGPAVRDFAVISTSSSSSTHLVTVLICRARAVVLCCVDEEGKLIHLSTTELKEEPLAATWRRRRKGGEELVVVVAGGDVVVLEKSGMEMRTVEEKEEEEEDDACVLMRLGKLHSDWLRAATTTPTTSLSHLYKQRYDNVTQYLHKKEERLKAEHAHQHGYGPPPTKKDG